jgi:hypothetical protein
MTALAFRPAGEHDQKFIVDAWISSYRDAKTAGLIQVEDWYAVMIPQIEKVLCRPDVRAIVAVIPGVTDRVSDLVGFIVVDTEDNPALVYYVFVKEHYRRAGNGKLWSGHGVARALFAAAGVDPAKPFNYVCSTPMCRILERKIPMSRWTPQFGRFPKHERRSRR